MTAVDPGAPKMSTGVARTIDTRKTDVAWYAGLRAANDYRDTHHIYEEGGQSFIETVLEAVLLQLGLRGA
jgi:hypothetical protein